MPLMSAPMAGNWGGTAGLKLVPSGRVFLFLYTIIIGIESGIVEMDEQYV